MKIFPSKEDVAKLRFELWKWVLLGLLGATVTLVIPPVRRSFWDVVRAILDSSERHISIPNPVLWTLCICLLFTVVVSAAEIQKRRGPVYQRQFRQGEYDRIIWRWNWRDARVEPDSMMPFCTKCCTQLILTPKADQWMRRSNGDGFTYTESMRPDIEIYCTACNDGWRVTNCTDVRSHVILKIEGDAHNKRWRTAYERVPAQFRF